MNAPPDTSEAFHARRYLRWHLTSIACALALALLSSLNARTSLASSILVLSGGFSMAHGRHGFRAGVAMLTASGQPAPTWIAPVARWATVIGSLLMIAGVVWTGLLLRAAYGRIVK